MRESFKLLLIFILSTWVTYSWADGTRNFVLTTDTVGNSTAGNYQYLDDSNSWGYWANEASLFLFNGSDGDYYKLGSVEASELQRFHVYIDDPDNEEIYLGFQQTYNGSSAGTTYFRVKDPNGNIVQAYTAIPTSFGTGYISSYKQVYEGPSPTVSSGGYTPIVVTPTSGVSGNYYIEFNNTNSGDNFGDNPSGNTNETKIYGIFDVSVGVDVADVGSKSHDLVEGRFWAYQFPMVDHYDGWMNYDGVNVDYYVYHDVDKVVTKLHWERVTGGGWFVQFNDIGPDEVYVSGNLDLNESRKSVTNVDSELATPKYPLFFSTPDETVYVPTTIAPVFEYEDYRLDCETGDHAFFFNLNRSGRLEVLMEFGDGYDNGYFDTDPNSTDRILIVEDVTLNRNKVLWDGLDGQDDSRTSATFSIYMKFSIGSVNNPMFDVEAVNGGLKATLVSPTSFGWDTDLNLYYDDTEVGTLGGDNYQGSTALSHQYDYADGNQTWVNSWWSAYDSTITKVLNAASVGPGLLPVDTIWGLNPSGCSVSDGEVYIEGLVGGDTYAVSYDKDGVTVGPSDYVADGNGFITISGLSQGYYDDFIVASGGCSSTTSSFNITLYCVTANDSILTCQTNPGGSNSIALSSGYFSGTAYGTNTITHIAFETFPANANSITIGASTYTAATFGSGVEITANSSGNPTQAISVDPLDDVASVEVYYKLKDNLDTYSGEAMVVLPFANMTLSSTVTGTSCAGATGAIDLTVAGGNSPYSFLWTEGDYTTEDLNSISTGTYFVTVTDAYGCTVDSTFTIDPIPISGTCNFTEETPPSGGGENSVVADNSSLSASGTSWNSETDVRESDDSRTADRLNLGETSSVLSISDFDMSLVPSDAIIKGLELKIEKRANNANTIEDALVELYTTSTSNDKSLGGYWPSNEAVYTYGGSVDLWGFSTVTRSDLDIIELRIQAYNDVINRTRAQIDYVELTVHYTLPSSTYNDAEPFTFSIDAYDEASTYVWSSSNGATVIDGQGTTTATFDFNNLGAGDYEICATPANACETVAPCCTTLTLVDSVGDLYITGNVYEDIDGSEGSDIVDGVGIDSLSGAQIYTYLVTTTDGLVVERDTVASNGSYRFETPEATTSYKVVVSTNVYSTGEVPTASLPDDWYFVGEIDNNFDNDLTGNDATGGSDQDGETNGEAVLRSSLSTNSESNLNFGVIYAIGDGNTVICPSDSVISECNPPVPSVGIATYTTDTYWILTSTGNDYPGVVTHAGCTYTRTVSYWAEWKVLGLFGSYKDTCEQVFTYTIDYEKPTFTVPDNDTVYKAPDCSFDASPAITGDVTDETDDCSSSLDAIYVDDTTALTSCEDTAIITRTWILTDDCGNEEIKTQTIFIDTEGSDYGDAPSYYDDGIPARHRRETVSLLYLGAIAPDREEAALSSLGVGDDTTGVDDEDGIAVWSTLSTTSTSYTTTVSVLNNTGETVYLSGYIDFDRDSIFDADERADATITISQVSNQNIVLTWTGLGSTVDLTHGGTYLRLRLATLQAEVQQPDGVAVDGEIEDYYLVVNEIETDSVTKVGETTATLYGQALAGGHIDEYGFYYSTDNVVSNLVNGSASEVSAYSGAEINLDGMSFSCDISSLTNRAGYYFRAYMRDTSGEYTYGKVVRFISERRDFSLELDGTDDALVIDEEYTASAINDWGVLNNTFSVEFWMKKGSATTDKQILCFNNSGSAGFEIFLEGGLITLKNHSTSSVSSAISISDDEWHYVAVSYDGNDAIICIDDSASTASAISITRPDGHNCFIGAGYNGTSLENYFSGNIDAMRFWNVVLTATQISELAYDNVQEGDIANSVQGVGSGVVIPSLQWNSLTASLGFNVKSTEESDLTIPVSFLYEDQSQLHQYPFFHQDVRLTADITSFNIVALGDAKPSPLLPRVNWRYDNVDSDWLSSENWSGYAYPGEGVGASVYPDVSSSTLADDSVYCKYAIINTSTESAVVTVTPPEIQVLVDREDVVGTYFVDETASPVLTILQKVSSALFTGRVVNEDASLEIENGSIEPHLE